MSTSSGGNGTNGPDDCDCDCGCGGDEASNDDGDGDDEGFGSATWEGGAIDEDTEGVFRFRVWTVCLRQATMLLMMPFRSLLM